MSKTAPPAVAQRLGFRLERWQRRGIYASGALLLLSGLAWLVARYFMRPVSEFGETVHPLEPWAMKLHGAAAMAFLFLVGSLVQLHIRRALRAGHNLVTGWAMIGTLLLLVLSGYGLYYVAGETDRPVWSALHWVVGLGTGVLLVLHIVVGRRSVR
jgi:Ni,Fe-hydrogenase I cytochrome b subunit